MPSETSLGFSDGILMNGTGYWELSSSKILSPSLIRRCFSQNGRRMKNYCPYPCQRRSKMKPWQLNQYNRNVRLVLQNKEGD
ncbi:MULTISPECIES: hypothetical protein [Neisseria]|uniref:hypothetical protein n=1 Tax=Neisseria TaxID=482 RepID=UPI00186560CF|nr:hypothetical protein [Neisseria sp. Marseille-Q1983]